MKLFSVCLQQVVRGREEGGRFQSEFPSLEEQEMIGKREQEEKRGKEGSREHSPARQKAWGEVRPPPLPPYPPHPPHPPHPYGPYMMPPSMRHGGEFINTTSPLFYLSLLSLIQLLSTVVDRCQVVEGTLHTPIRWRGTTDPPFPHTLNPTHLTCEFHPLSISLLLYTSNSLCLSLSISCSFDPLSISETPTRCRPAGSWWKATPPDLRQSDRMTSAPSNPWKTTEGGRGTTRRSTTPRYCVCVCVCVCGDGVSLVPVQEVVFSDSDEEDTHKKESKSTKKKVSLSSTHTCLSVLVLVLCQC